MLLLVSLTWVTATQFLKATYHHTVNTTSSFAAANSTEKLVVFSAPFLTCWFCMVWTILFFPLYVVCTRDINIDGLIKSLEHDRGNWEECEVKGGFQIEYCVETIEIFKQCQENPLNFNEYCSVDSTADGVTVSNPSRWI